MQSKSISKRIPGELNDFLDRERPGSEEALRTRLQQNASERGHTLGGVSPGGRVGSLGMPSCDEESFGISSENPDRRRLQAHVLLQRIVLVEDEAAKMSTEQLRDNLKQYWMNMDDSAKDAVQNNPIDVVYSENHPVRQLYRYEVCQLRNDIEEYFGLPDRSLVIGKSIEASDSTRTWNDLRGQWHAKMHRARIKLAEVSGITIKSVHKHWLQNCALALSSAVVKATGSASVSVGDATAVAFTSDLNIYFSITSFFCADADDVFFLSKSGKCRLIL